MENPSRRRVLTAGLAGTTLALAGWRTAHATTPPTPPERPTDADTEVLAALQGLELAARDLYQTAIDAGASDEAGVLTTLRSNHEGYANGISGLIGGAAPQTADDAIFAQFEADFDTSDLAAVADAGYEFESSVVATYLEALGQLEGIDGAALDRLDPHRRVAPVRRPRRPRRPRRRSRRPARQRRRSPLPRRRHDLMAARSRCR